MKYNPNIHHRRSIRLQGYDYSQEGLYFITICTQNKLCLFGKIEDGNMQLNVAGNMIRQQWLGLVHRFNKIKLHEFVVMPNHFHGIIELVGVPLVGTQNDDNPHFANQPETEQSQMGQLPIIGQQNVGVPLVGTPNDDNPHFVEQPQTPQPQTPQSQTRQSQTGQLSIVLGQPQGIAPTTNIQNAKNRPKIERPQTEQSQTGQLSIMGQPQGIAPTVTVGDVVGAFKSLSANEYIKNVKQNNWQPFNKKLWQRNYYEHIIRNEKSYQCISEYIINNAKKWADDCYHV